MKEVLAAPLNMVTLARRIFRGRPVAEWEQASGTFRLYARQPWQSWTEEAVGIHCAIVTSISGHLWTEIWRLVNDEGYK